MGLGGIVTDGIDQPTSLRAGRTLPRGVGRAQRAGRFQAIRDLRIGRNRKGAGDIDVTGRHPKRQQPIGSIEPLLVIVDQSVRGIGHQEPENRNTGLAHLRFAGDRAAYPRVPSVGRNHQIDAVQPMLPPRLRPGDRCLADVGGVTAYIGDIAAIADRRPGGLAQHVVKFRPSDAPAGSVGNLLQRQIEQHGPVGERDPPIVPEVTRLGNTIGKLRIDRF